jgi:ubiquinone/menaquinone biosynthesis C-methylase UbiE
MLNVEVFKKNERLAWNMCAGQYDRRLTPAFGPFCEELVALAHLRRGQKVLDVATGSGLAAFLSAPLVGPEGQVIGTDLSDTMIELARERAVAEGVDNVQFIRMDAESLDFPPGSFDAVLCSLGLMLFPSPDEALSEMHRVLRPRGRAALCVFGRGSKVGLRALMEPFIPYMPPPAQRGPSTFGFGRSEVLEQALQRAGFSAIDSKQIPRVLAFHDVGGVWEMVLSLGRLAQIYSKLGANAQQRLEAEVIQIARDRFTGPTGGVELPFEITYAVAHK